MHDSRLVGQRLFAYVHSASAARGGLHVELTALQSQQHAVPAHARRGLIRQPVGIVDRPRASKVIPIESHIARPAMTSAPELCAIAVAEGIEMIGQDLHLLSAVEAHTRCALVLVAQVAERGRLSKAEGRREKASQRSPIQMLGKLDYSPVPASHRICSSNSSVAPSRRVPCNALPPPAGVAAPGRAVATSVLPIYNLPCLPQHKL